MRFRLTAAAAAFVLCGCMSWPGRRPVRPARAAGRRRGDRRSSRPITETSDFVGRVQATDRVDIVARVTAFIEERLFTEGTEVKQGDLLYRLERAPVRGRPARQAGGRRADARRCCATPPSR